MNENKRKNVLTKYKDLRVRAAIEIKKMWFTLGDGSKNKPMFLPQMVEPFMRVALIPISDIHNAIIPLFFDMIQCEHAEKANQSQATSGRHDFEKYAVPRQLITTLDAQITLGMSHSKSRNAFEKILKVGFI